MKKAIRVLMSQNGRIKCKTHGVLCTRVPFPMSEHFNAPEDFFRNCCKTCQASVGTGHDRNCLEGPVVPVGAGFCRRKGCPYLSRKGEAYCCSACETGIKKGSDPKYPE